MSKPTLSEILDEFVIHNRYSDGTCFNDGVTHSYIQSQLTQLIADIINTQKDIYLKNDLPSMLATDDYIKTREELRAEQRQKAKDLGVDL